MKIHELHPEARLRLTQWVRESMAMPFEWGRHDCGISAATAVQVQLKDRLDLAADFRGKYSTFEGGLKLLRKAGFADHAALAASALPEIPVAEAQIGDIVAVDFGEQGVTLMLVAGHRIIGPMPTMAGNLPLTQACRAFAVGRDPESADA
jgi:hypothetical protein